MKKLAASVILLTTLLLCQQTYAQKLYPRIPKKYQKNLVESLDKDKEKLSQINSLLEERNCDGTQHLVTEYFFADTVSKIQNLISGTTVREGKVAATSASIEEKNASLNFNRRFSDILSAQINLTGQSDDGFVSIFDGGKYKRTVGVGGTINYFTLHPKIKYDCPSWYFLHNMLKSFTCNGGRLGASKPEIEFYMKEIEAFIKVYESSDSVRRKFFDKCDTLKVKFDHYTLYNRLKEELKDILPAKWDNLNKAETDQFIERLKDNTDRKEQLARHLVEAKQISSIDSIQAMGEWNTLKIQWFTVKGSWQQKQYQYLNVSNSADFYTENYVDNYFSGSVSYNFLWANMRRKVNTWLSPTIKIETKRDFSTDSMIHLSRQRDFIIGTDTLTNIQKDATLHTKVPGPQTTLTFEIPFTIYFPKTNYGIEIAANAQIVPGIDNVGGRFGIYLPVDVQDGSAVIIEPLIRFTKLNKTGLDFLKEQLAFGFNVSVTIPKFLKN